MVEHGSAGLNMTPFSGCCMSPISATTGDYRLIHRTWLVPVASAGLSTSATYAPNRASEPCFFATCEHCNLSCGVPALNQTLYRSLPRPQAGHDNLAKARAYRLTGLCSEPQFVCAKSVLFSETVRGGFFDSLLHGTYGTVDYPAPLAQPCICRSLDPTANRFRTTLRRR